MQPTIDPYYRWLGIPPEDQPPDHYRLLGLRVFEADADAIESAADLQMRHIQAFEAGDQSPASRQLLNEVAAARLCLLEPDSKVAYDSQLKAAISASVAAVATAATLPPTRVAPVAKPPAAPSRWTPLLLVVAAIGVFASAAWLVRRLSPTAPKLNPVANRTIDEGHALELDLTTADPGTQLIYELLAGSPAGCQLNRDTGRLVWTPSEAQGPGVHRFSVRASVAGSPHLSDEIGFQVTVNEVPQPPQFEPVELRQSNRFPAKVECELMATDVDRPTGKIAYSVKIDPVPSGAPTIDSDSGVFVWWPAVADMGRSYQVTFGAAKSLLPDVASEQTVIVALPCVAYGPEHLAAELGNAGIDVHNVQRVKPTVFGGQLDLYEVDNHDVYVTEFALGGDAADAVTQLDLHQNQFNGRPLKFRGPTHFFRKGRLLVHYVGEDRLLLDRLTTILGNSIGTGRPTNDSNRDDVAAIVLPSVRSLPADKPTTPPKTADGARLPPLPGPDDPQRDRLVAEAILSFPHCQMRVDKNLTLVSRKLDLPTTPFVIREVTVAGASAPDGLLEFLVGQPDLERIIIKPSARISDAGIAHLAGIESLKSVELQSDLLTDACFDHLAKLPHLQWLHAYNGRFTDDGLEKLAGSAELHDLLVWGQCTDAGLFHLVPLTRLKTLSLGSDGITGAGLSHLANLPQLADLSLNCPNLADEHVPLLVECKKLTALSLKSNNSDAIWDVLPSLSQLKSLTLDSPELTPAGITELGAIPDLQRLRLRGDGPPLTDDDCASLTRLRWLIVDRGEQLTNAGLAELSRSTSLKQFTLYQARQITDEGLAQLSKITNLDLALWDAANITDEGLLNLREPSLRSIQIKGSQISEAGWEHFHKQFPKCIISR